MQAFTKKLLLWHQEHNTRTMPWKGETDPYKIWLSEVMLQQTRVEQGLPYYLRFIRQYPTVAQLAAASDDDVFKLWEGLGYYSRCRNLLAAARTVVSKYGGQFPTTYAEILDLKGVGPYTSAAIASFAFQLPYAVVDGNVTRVLSRYFAIFTPADSGEGKKEFAALAQQLLPTDTPDIFNQAIMDFGATVCKPKAPLCTACPLAKTCKARQQQLVDQLPVKGTKGKITHRFFHYFIITQGKKVLVTKRQGRDVWQHLYEFVLWEKENDLPLPPAETEAYIRNATQLNAKFSAQLPAGKQQLTHQLIHLRYYQMKTADALPTEPYQFVTNRVLSQMAFPRSLAKVVAAYLKQANLP